MNVNAKLKSLFGIGFAGFIALFALHGKAFVDALMGLPMLVQAWSAALPLGVWSSLLALAVAMGTWAFVMHWLPQTRAGNSPSFAADTMSILVAIAVTVGQQWAAKPAGPGPILSAVWMGLAAGFLAPYLAKGLRSLFAPAKCDVPEAPPE